MRQNVGETTENQERHCERERFFFTPDFFAAGMAGPTEKPSGIVPANRPARSNFEAKNQKVISTWEDLMNGFWFYCPLAV
jgi:hypothetical protein